MILDTTSAPKTKAPAERKHLETLAARVLSVVSGSMSSSPEKVADAVVSQLASDFMNDDPEVRTRSLASLLESGVSPNAFIESCAPAVAERVGALWADNKISFADVTIAVARLQEAVRHIRRRRIHRAELQAKANVLLVAAEVENHLLGLLVATEGFERLGCRVRLMLGEQPSDIVSIARAGAFDLIGVSVGSLRTLRAATELVARIRKGVPQAIPIVVGGPLAHLDPDALSTVGADHIVCDPKEALELSNVDLFSMTAPDNRGGIEEGFDLDRMQAT